MIKGRSIASSVIQHLKNPPNGHQTTTILVSPQWTFGGICCGSAEASTLCPACPGLCVALASLAPLKNFSHTKVSLGVFGFFKNLLSFFFFYWMHGSEHHCFEKSPTVCFSQGITLRVSWYTNTQFVLLLLCNMCIFWTLKGTTQAAFSVNHLLPLFAKSIMGPAPKTKKGWWVILIT